MHICIYIERERERERARESEGVYGVMQDCYRRQSGWHGTVELAGCRKARQLGRIRKVEPPIMDSSTPMV